MAHRVDALYFFLIGLTAFFSLLARMGARVALEESERRGGETVGTITVESDRLAGVEIAPDEVPDLIDALPLVAVLGARARGTTPAPIAGRKTGGRPASPPGTEGGGGPARNTGGGRPPRSAAASSSSRSSRARLASSGGIMMGREEEATPRKTAPGRT